MHLSLHDSKDQDLLEEKAIGLTGFALSSQVLTSYKYVVDTSFGLTGFALSSLMMLHLHMLVKNKICEAKC
jgi:hypothetical protein